MPGNPRTPAAARAASTDSSATSAVPGAGSPARDTAIDLLRGLCIVSMTTAHLAAGSWPFHVAHAAVFVDGAVGFVLLSGVVVGMTQRRTIDRDGRAAGQRKLLRRSLIIYTAQLGLCAVAMLVVAVDPAREGPYAGVSSLGGSLPAALAAVTLRVNPHYTSILSLYVVLLLLSVAAVAALALGRAELVVAGSLALYAAGWAWPSVFIFALRPGEPGAVNWATWQLLFAAALLVGWYWRSTPIRRAVRSRALLTAATVSVLAAAATGWVVTGGLPSSWKSFILLAFTEGTLAPATIVLAFAAVLVGYRVCRVLVRWVRPVVSPVARLGRHSLHCYLLLSLAVIVLPSLFVYEPSGLIGVGVTFDVLLAMFGWCVLRDSARGRVARGSARRRAERVPFRRAQNTVESASDRR